MIYRLFTLIFFVIFNFTFSKEPNQLQKEKIVIGIINEPFFNLSYPNIQSLNETAKIFLKDYMKFNVTFKSVSYRNLEDEIESGKLDGVALIPKNHFFDKYLDFSDSIFSEELYVVSENNNVNSLDDLNNKIVYTPYMKSYIEIFNSILDNNDLDAFPVPVENLGNYAGKLILTTNPVLYKPDYGIKIGNSSGVTIALTHRYKNLIPLINHALTTKYKDIFLKDLANLNKAVSYNNFYTSLTLEEKEYLKNLSPIKVAYENKSDSLVSYKSQISGEYKGIAPNIFNILKNHLKIDFIDATNSSDKNPENLKNKEFDVMILSKTKERSKNFIFSKKIHEINTYVINLDNSPSSSGTIGVLKDNVEEHIAKRYDVQGNIIIFNDTNSMIKALNNGEVGNLLVTNKEVFDSNKYNIIPFETIPVNLMFNKEDKLLRDIINKAFNYAINVKKLAEISQLERDAENKTIYLKNKEQEKQINK